MRKNHTYDIADYVRKDIWRRGGMLKDCMRRLISRSSLCGYVMFVFLLLITPVYHLQAGNLSALSSYQQILAVQASVRYLQTLSEKISSMQAIRNTILAFGNYPVTQESSSPTEYVPVSRCPQKEEVSDPSFFAETAFLGDSITEGLMINSPVDDITILAAKGMTLKKALTEVPKLVLAAPKKVYILLGINDMTDYNAPIERHISSYRTLLTTLMEKLPDSTLYVQSVFPIANHYNNTKTKLTNEKVEQFNEELSSLCQELGLRFIDISLSLKDENGCMISTLSSDGLHLKAAYYPFWLNLLMENSN